MAKRKGIPWGKGNPLWDWQHRKTLKAESRKSRVVGEKKLAKKKYSYVRRIYRRGRRSKKIPLAATLGLASGIFETSGYWAGSAYDRLMAGDIGNAVNVLKEQYLGIVEGGKFDIMRAHGLRNAAIGIGISMLASKLGANKYIQKIPFIKL